MKRKLFLAALLVIVAMAGGFFLVAIQTGVSPQSIASSVTRTANLLDKAWRLPVAATFRNTVDSQSNGSRCGPASAANVFRSLGEPAQTEAEVLDDTGLCWTGHCIMGLTLDELAELIRMKTSRKVTVLRDLTADQFHEHMRRTNDTRYRYIVNFARSGIFGAGSGHHSPIGGYLEGEDMVFVLDVNRKFGPWLVERDRLFAAVDTLDGDSKRGLLLIE